MPINTGIIYMHAQQTYIYMHALFCSYIMYHLKTITFVKCLEDDQDNPNSNELKFKYSRIAGKGTCKYFLLNS